MREERPDKSYRDPYESTLMQKKADHYESRIKEDIDQTKERQTKPYKLFNT